MPTGKSLLGNYLYQKFEMSSEEVKATQKALADKNHVWNFK